MRRNRVGILAIVLAMAAPAWAGSGDRVTVTNQDGNTLVTLSGMPSSSASEIYAILEKAGASQGQLIQASVVYLNGAIYTARLTVNSASTYGVLPDRCAPAEACRGNTTQLIIGGQVARELFTDLQKAGYSEAHGIDQDFIRADTLSCSVFYSGAVRYSCSISI